MTIINIYYQSLKYTSIIQLPKTKPKQLVSNLGGYLGLFVGLSFVSLFEIVEIIFEIVFILRGNTKVKEPEIKPVVERVWITEMEQLKKENEEKFNLLKMEVNNLIEDIHIKFMVNFKMFFFLFKTQSYFE